MRNVLPLTLLVVTLAVPACDDAPVEPQPSDADVESEFLQAGIQVLEASGNTIVGTRHGGQRIPDLVRFTPDLQNFQVLEPEASPWIELNPTASPVADRILFQQGYPDTRIVEVVGDSLQLLISGSGPAHQIWPQFTADGASVVFAGGEDAGMARAVWLVGAAGGDAAPLWTADDEVVSPSMSPSGERIAFVRRNASTLEIVDLESETTLASIDSVTIARWSPTAERIAMVRNGDLYVVAGDGTDLAYVASGEIAFTPRNLAWSPDGAWVVVHQAEDAYPWMGPLTLIEIDTGEMVTLIERTDVSQATWGL